jgi:acyl-coenzyme A synthetase/AMP-(fatty) acid ligase
MCLGKVSHYKQLKGGVEFVNEIPKSASGKILRRVLRDRHTATTTNKEDNNLLAKI